MAATASAAGGGEGGSADSASAYIDYDAFLAPDFSALAFAHTLVAATHTPADPHVDLAAPLARVLFDVQEVDTHLHGLATTHAAPLLAHAAAQQQAAATALAAAEAQVARLAARHAQLDADVVQRHAVAEEVRLAASRLWVTVKIGRGVQRALRLGRQLDADMEAALRPASTATTTMTTTTAGTAAATGSGGAADEAAAVVRAANSVLALKALLAASGPGQEGEHLSRIDAVATLRTDLLSPAEQRLRARAQQIMREFTLPGSSSSSSSNSGTESAAAATIANSTAAAEAPAAAPAPAVRARTAAAAQALYLLSPPPAGTAHPASAFAPALLLAATDAYLRAANSSAGAALGRALAQPAGLSRACADAAARCQAIAALERLLAGVQTPEHPLLAMTSSSSPSADADPAGATLLAPVLAHLDTGSLPSHFWRSLASDLGPRVAEVLQRGGAPARQLRGARERWREGLRDAVRRGCAGARGPGGRAAGSGAWEREVTVMVGSVVGPLSR